MTATLNDTEILAALLAHLHRGGTFQYFWQLEGKRSTWWNSGGPPALPATRDLYFGVHPTGVIPSTNSGGEPAEPHAVRSQIKHIAAINCLFAEFDAKDFGGSKIAALDHVHRIDLVPSVIIDSGGGYHAYWLLDQPWLLADERDRRQAVDLQARWVAFVKSDSDAKDLARVLRVPGTFNCKPDYDQPLAVDFVRCDLAVLYTREALEAVLPPADTTHTAPAPPVARAEMSLDDVSRAAAALDRLAAWRRNDYNHIEGWVGVGMALSSLGEPGLALWKVWSQGSSKYKAGECERKWKSFDPNGDKTLRSLIYWANEDDPGGKPQLADPPDLVEINGARCCPECYEPALVSKFSGLYCPNHKPVLHWKHAQPRAHAPEQAQDTTGPTTLKLLHASRLDTIPPTTWLIDGVLAMNKLSQTFAPPGSGKSFTELDKALCVAQTHPVIYVAAEAVEDYQDRVAAWCAHHKKEPGQLYFWPEPVYLRSPDSVNAFLTQIRVIGPAAIFIDPLASCMVGLEESSTGDMTIAVEALNRIRRETGAAIEIVHHTGWSEAHERGSSVLRAACRIVMKLSLDDSGLMTLTCEKANNGKPFAARYFRLVAAGPSAVPVPANRTTGRDAPLSAKQLDILEALDMAHFRSGATHTQLVEHTGFAKSTVNKAIARLIDLGQITFIGERTKYYMLTETGKYELQIRSTDTVIGAPGTVHHDSEQGVNWRVNKVAHGEQGVNSASESQTADGITKPNAKVVHQQGEQNSSPEFTTATASECASSPEFTPCSPQVHPTEFTSSPPVSPLGDRGGEQETSEHDELTSGGSGATTAPATPNYRPRVNFVRSEHSSERPLTYGDFEEREARRYASEGKWSKARWWAERIRPQARSAAVLAELEQEQRVADAEVVAVQEISS